MSPLDDYSAFRTYVGVISADSHNRWHTRPGSLKHCDCSVGLVSHIAIVSSAAFSPHNFEVEIGWYGISD